MAAPAFGQKLQYPFVNEEHMLASMIANDLASMAARAGGKESEDLILKPDGSGNYTTTVGGKAVQIQRGDFIWSPDDYLPLLKALSPGAAAKKGESKTEVLEPLLAPTSDVMRKLSQELSAKILETPYDRSLHGKAALLAGTLALREAAFDYYDPAVALCRMSAHLAFAKHLEGATAGREEALAGILLNVLVRRTKVAVEMLDAFKPANESEEAWCRVLRTRAKLDWRVVTEPEDATLLERLEYYRARRMSVSAAAGAKYLNAHGDSLEPVQDWMMVALDNGFSVGLGHIGFQGGFPFLAKDLAECFGIDLEKASEEEAIAKIGEKLKVPLVPRFLSPDGKGAAVISDGMWSHFYQRHFLHYAGQAQYFTDKMWGNPEAWDELMPQLKPLYERMELYPLGKIYFAENPGAHAKALEEGIAFGLAHPEWTPISAWRRFEKGSTRFGQGRPVTWITKWFTPPTPAGTAFEAWYRYRPMIQSDHPEIALAWHEIDPYNYWIVDYLREQPRQVFPLEKEHALLGELLEYNAKALSRHSAAYPLDAPERIKLLRRLREIEPSDTRALGKYLIENGQPDEAAEAYQAMIDDAGSAVSASGVCGWLIEYYMKAGRKAEAEKVAEFGAEVYSFNGLEAAVKYYRMAGDGAKAIETALNLAERYGDPSLFCAMVSAFPDAADKEQKATAKEAMVAMFPDGLKKAALADFAKAGPPKDGVLVSEDSATLEANGMKAGDVIVALDGYRVTDGNTYRFIRTLKDDLVLDLILYDGKTYRHVKAKSDPGRMLGFDIVDYR